MERLVPFTAGLANRLLSVLLLVAPPSSSPQFQELFEAEKSSSAEESSPDKRGEEWKLLSTSLPPLLKEDDRRIGSVETMNTEDIMPAYKYRPRHEILRLMDSGFYNLCRHYRPTGYFIDQKDRHGIWVAVKKLALYYRLMRSMQVRGPIFDPETRKNLPFVLRAGDICVRLDGAHRSSVARYLGYREIPVLVLSPAEVFTLPDLPDKITSLVTTLERASHSRDQGLSSPEEESG